MVPRTGDALTRWAYDHRWLAGALFGLAAVLVVGVSVAIAGVPWLATFLIALGAGVITALTVGVVSRSEHVVDRAAAARYGVNHPYLGSLLGGLHLVAYGAVVLRMSLWVSAAIGAGLSLLLLPWLKWVIPRELERYDKGVRFLPPRPPRRDPDARRPDDVP